MAETITYKASVASYVNLPTAGNTRGDVRTVMDTGVQYWWSAAVGAGGITDWKVLNGVLTLREKRNWELASEYKAASLLSYKEFTYVGKNLTAVNVYDAPAKVCHLFNKALTYVGKNLTQSVLTRISDGATLTKTFTYVANKLVSVIIT